MNYSELELKRDGFTWCWLSHQAAMPIWVDQSIIPILVQRAKIALKVKT